MYINFFYVIAIAAVLLFALSCVSVVALSQDLYVGQLLLQFDQFSLAMNH